MLEQIIALVLVLGGVVIATFHHYDALKWLGEWLWERTGITDVIALVLMAAGALWLFFRWRAAIPHQAVTVSVFEMLNALRSQIDAKQKEMRDNGVIPRLFMDHADVEAQFTIEKEANSEIKFHAVKLGTKVRGEEVHSIKCQVKLGDGAGGGAGVAGSRQDDSPRGTELKDLKE